VLRVVLRELAGVVFRGHHEGEVLVQEHRNQQRRSVIGIDRTVVHPLANTDLGDHGVVIALHQLGLVDQVTGLGVVPTRLGIVLPLDQPGGPGQFEHTGGRQLAGHLHLEAGTRGTVRSELGATDDHHHVGGVDVEIVPRRRRCGGIAARR
jgi:hypothetical protein